MQNQQARHARGRQLIIASRGDWGAMGDWEAVKKPNFRRGEIWAGRGNNGSTILSGTLVPS